MASLLQEITNTVEAAFEAAGYDKSYGKVSVSNRPDLCEYQCNGAMAGAKAYKKAPIAIANEVLEQLKDNSMFSKAEAVMPGFLNFDLSADFVAEFTSKIAKDERMGAPVLENAPKIMIDYGGPNIAKPLHVGHLRSAIIGESIKRICRYMGSEVIGDVHLGDWGLQLGLIITELHDRKPDLIYYDEAYEGEYPSEAPFAISELEEIYPYASAKSKEDEDYKARAMEATKQVQSGRRGYRALLDHILNVSVTDLKKNYDKLAVSFDLWKGESDAQPYIPDMVAKMKADGFAYESEGALVVDVKEETDTKEIPPCMILKSDGASLYNTTDLATLVWRMKDYNPDHVIYVVDKRQDLYFTQVFRCAKKTGIVSEDKKLTFVGFGTMNGSDGKPFKTRSGGVMRLEYLLDEVYNTMLTRIRENDTMSEEEAEKTARIVALAALKYGDLSNQASKDYVFDIDRFTSAEGNTGPYLLYTTVRIKSILRKYEEQVGEITKGDLLSPANDSEKELMLAVSGFGPVCESAYEELAPHKICSYLYDLSNAFNHFYHENRIMATENKERQKSYIRLLVLTRDILEQGMELLGFESPERM